MRLNFSARDEDEIREGIRRIGKVVKEQVALYGTLTGETRAGRRARRGRAGRRAPRSCGCRRRAGATSAGRGHVSRVAVLKGGRSLERQVSLRSGARVEDALERLGHEVVPIDVGADLIERLREAEPDVAFVAMHGRDGEDGTVQELLEIARHPVHGLGRARLRAGDATRCSPSTCCSRTGIPTPEFFAFNETAFERARRRPSAARDRGAARLPDRREAGERRLGARDQVRPHGRRRAGRARARLLLRRRGCCSSATWPAATSRCRSLDGEALPVVEAVPRDEDFYDFEARYEIGRTDFVCPAELPGERGRARPGARAARRTGCSAAPASPAST